jgi:U2 small nuclear ribonucleoprotein A'
LQAAIANAATLEEVARLEEALRTGHLPSQLAAAANGMNGDAGAAAMEEG